MITRAAFKLRNFIYRHPKAILAVYAIDAAFWVGVGVALTVAGMNYL